MELKLDMHIHSHYSPDGRMSLDEIVERAKAAGLDGCAVCDHDHVLPAEDVARMEARYPDFLLIPGVEVSTDRGHLLGWFVTEPVETRAFAEAVRAIHEQGGIAVLAHPFEHSREAGRIEPAVPLVDGVEVWNSRAERKNRRANAMAEQFAAAHGLRRFGGSDAHVPREIGNGVTTVKVNGITAVETGGAAREAVRTALLSGETAVTGRRSRAVDTAASQWTKRKKSGAGWISTCKWALFAVKCLWQDALFGG